MRKEESNKIFNSDIAEGIHLKSSDMNMIM